MMFIREVVTKDKSRIRCFANYEVVFATNDGEIFVLSKYIKW